MKFVISKEGLFAALAPLTRIIPKNPMHPIMKNVRFQANQEESTLTVTGFDGMLGIITKLELNVVVSGSFTLPFAMLHSIVAQLEGDLKFELKNEVVTLTALDLGSKYKIHGIPDTEYPELPLLIGDDSKFELPPLVLADLIRSVLYAVSSDQSKQILTAINWRGNWRMSDEGTPEVYLDLAATDGHRLASASRSTELSKQIPVQADEPKPVFDFNVPGRALSELQRLIPKAQELLVQYDERGYQVQFNVDNKIIFSRLYGGQYPDYERLFPTEFQCRTILPRQDLLQVLRRLSVVSPTEALTHSKLITVELCQKEEDQQKIGQLILTASNPSLCEANEYLEIQLNGQPLKLRLNVIYLIQCLESFVAEQVEVSFSGAISPLVIVPIESDLPQRALLMPVQLQSSN